VLRVLLKLTGGILLCLLALTTATASALTLEQIGDFEEPIYVTSDPGNADRLFVVERKGTVVLVQNGETRPFADIRAKVSTEGEGGLLSIALAPDFGSSGRIFLYYTDTDKPAGEIHVAEMTVVGNSAAASTLRDVIPSIPHPEDTNHYGGQLQFGAGGALFVSTGDGGGGDDEHHNAQNPSSPLGKILRLSAPISQSALTTPAVWSLGLRNPFRFSFDRLTGDLWIGDVGQGSREEIDFAAAPGSGQGANFGWNCMEGTLPGPATDPECAGTEATDFVPPLFEYTNPPTNCAAVIGGYVARGPGMADLYGRYVYGDLCGGEVRSLSPSFPSLSDRSENLDISNLNSFGEDACGRLYAVSGDGPVYRLGGEGPSCATATPAPPHYDPVLTPAYIAIRAVSRKVKRNRRGLITAWVTPCDGRRGDPVTLWRGRRNMGSGRLDRACSVRFRPRISRRSSFRATVRGDGYYLPAISRKLTIKPVRRHR
jgi:glucose/arabinose dehydrogenase